MLGAIRQKLWLISNRNQRPRFDYQRKRRDDRAHNAVLAKGQSKILIVRDFAWGAEYNDHFISWARTQHPGFGTRLRLARLPAFDEDLSDVALLVPWLQDPLKEAFPTIYKHALQLQKRCQAMGIPVINPIERLSNSIKSRALPLLASCGARAAKVEIINDVQDFCRSPSLEFPFFIRDDYEHGCPTRLIQAPADLDTVDWSQWCHPIAVEFIDTRCSDGYYRKYRYYLFGDIGQSRHLVVSGDWNVRAQVRVKDPAFDTDEWEFFSKPNPHHDLFNKLRRALGYDFVAFDYAIDLAGNVVVWEPNPFPIVYNGATPQGSRSHYIEPVYKKLKHFFESYISETH